MLIIQILSIGLILSVSLWTTAFLQSILQNGGLFAVHKSLEQTKKQNESGFNRFYRFSCIEQKRLCDILGRKRNLATK